MNNPFYIEENKINVVLLARPRTGKSTLCSDFINEILNTNKRKISIEDKEKIYDSEAN